jgi:hypothetical protein
MKLASEEVKEELDKGNIFPGIGDVIKSDKILFEGHDEWIVIDVKMTGGKTGVSPIDYKADGYYVTVQQLEPDGTYSEKGFVHKFYMTGNFSNKIKPEEIEVVRRMKRIFV